MGYPIMDPIASIAISVLILKVGIDIYLQSVKELIDTAADKETVQKIKVIIEGVEGVRRIDNLKTRMHANRIYVDRLSFVF